MNWQSKMGQVIEYIEENLTSEIDLKIIAKIAGYSMWDFQRMFSFVSYTTIGDYIRGRKLTAASHEIQNTMEKIIDIAIKYGYDSSSAFSRAFSRQFGVSPIVARNEKMVLKQYPKLIFQTNKTERTDFMTAKNDMQIYSERGYYVKENAPIYFTNDMERTANWFRETLGWFGGIVDESSGNYGCVFDYPGELIISGLTPFRGIHLFNGEPRTGIVGFINVQGLEQLRNLVLASGWNEISEITETAWGSKECYITTVDGCELHFFEESS
jgi:AraC family transcriptional regulator